MDIKQKINAKIAFFESYKNFKKLTFVLENLMNFAQKSSEETLTLDTNIIYQLNRFLPRGYLSKSNEIKKID